MTVGELYDLLTEKLHTGEFNRFDPLYVHDGDDHYTVDNLEKCQGEYVNIVSDELEGMVMDISAEYASAVSVPLTSIVAEVVKGE